MAKGSCVAKNFSNEEGFTRPATSSGARCFGPARYQFAVILMIFRYGVSFRGRGSGVRRDADGPGTVRSHSLACRSEQQAPAARFLEAIVPL